MKTLLKVQSSLHGETAQSAQLADRYVAQWLALNPGGRVVTRDVSKDPVPHLTSERFAAFASKAEARTAEQQAVLNYSDALIAEVKNADDVVFAVPMYNFGVPSTLRAYFDHIARSGVTFKYTATGPQGLLTGKQTTVFITRGGFYPEINDTQTAYLKQFLGFIGLANVQFVYAEGLSIDAATREKGIRTAQHTIAKLYGEALAA
ncbi:MAG TPA: NAD(P)H-dependent oxidoreductase [Steroidobacteraceae bacterium]|nr:NAD(P)H-dependent oxidoreductase [Steroidobacteraceae bacterium]